MATTHYRVLGPIEVVTAAGTVPIPSRRQRALLAALIIANGRRLTKAQLADIIWGVDAPANPEGAIHTLVSRLRRILPSDGMVTRPKGYFLRFTDSDTDATRFVTMVEQARAVRDEDPVTALELLSSALDLWRGTAYEEFADHPFFIPEIERLHETQMTASEDMFDLYGELGREIEAIPLLEQHVRKHPLRERPVHQLMTFLYAEGRQNDALETYARHRAFLVREIGIEPSQRLKKLESDILTQRVSHRPTGRQPTVTTRPPNVVSEFFGRDRELTQLARLAASTRLVTVLGPGGVGKSLLVTEYLRRTAGPDSPVHVADVSKARDAEGVARALTDVMGSETWRTDSDLGHTTLVFDNCEHVLDEIRDTVGVLLSRNRFVRIIVTSRRRLDVVGERVLEVGPLAVPARDDVAMAAASPAVALLLDRMAAVRDIELSDDNVAPILAICRAVDGIPLGLATIAPQVRGISISDLARRVAAQQPLGPAVDASYTLLPPTLRTAFRRVSVFRGPFTAAAMRVVCDMERRTVAEVEQVALDLVDHSMLRIAEGTGDTRYVVLDVLRRRGADLLADAGEAEQTAENHARYFTDVANKAVTGSRGEGDSLDLLDDLEAAAAWCAAHDDSPDRAFTLLAFLRSAHLHQLRYARTEPARSRRGAGRHLTELAEQALTRWGGHPHAHLSRVAAMAAAGQFVLGAFDNARGRATQAIAAETLPGAEPAVHARQVLACIAHLVDDDQTAAAQYVDEATQMAHPGDDAVLVCELALLSATIRATCGDRDSAIRITESASRDAVSLGNPHLVAWSRLQLGTLYLGSSVERARVVLELAAEDARRVGLFRGAATRALALVCTSLGELGEAARLLTMALDDHGGEGARLGLRHTIATSIPVLVAADEYTVAASVLGALEHAGTPIQAVPGAPVITNALTEMTTTVHPSALDALRVRGSLLKRSELIREIEAALTRVMRVVAPSRRYVSRTPDVRTA